MISVSDDEASTVQAGGSSWGTDAPAADGASVADVVRSHSGLQGMLRQQGGSGFVGQAHQSLNSQHLGGSWFSSLRSLGHSSSSLGDRSISLLSMRSKGLISLIAFNASKVRDKLRSTSSHGRARQVTAFVAIAIVASLIKEPIEAVMYYYSCRWVFSWWPLPLDIFVDLVIGMYAVYLWRNRIATIDQSRLHKAVFAVSLVLVYFPYPSLAYVSRVPLLRLARVFWQFPLIHIRDEPIDSVLELLTYVVTEAYPYKSLIRNFALLLVTMHLVACFELSLLTEMTPETNWLTKKGLELTCSTGELEVAVASAAGLQAYHWAMCLLFPIGHIRDGLWGSIKEELLILVTAAIGTIQFMVLFDSAVVIMRRLRKDTLEIESYMSKVRAYMERRQLPDTLRSRILNFVRYDFDESKEGRLEHDLLDEMPYLLRGRVVDQLYKQIIANVPLFQGNDSGFIASVLLSFKIELYPPYEYIIRVGTLGREMFVIIKGEVEILLHGKKVGVSKQGDAFGEIAMLLDVKRTANVRAIVYCELLKLRRNQFDILVSDFPEVLITVEKMGLSRLKSMELLIDKLQSKIETEVDVIRAGTYRPLSESIPVAKDILNAELQSLMHMQVGLGESMFEDSGAHPLLSQESSMSRTISMKKERSGTSGLLNAILGPNKRKMRVQVSAQRLAELHQPQLQRESSKTTPKGGQSPNQTPKGAGTPRGATPEVNESTCKTSLPDISEGFDSSRRLEGSSSPDKHEEPGGPALSILLLAQAALMEEADPEADGDDGNSPSGSATDGDSSRVSPSLVNPVPILKRPPSLRRQLTLDNRRLAPPRFERSRSRSVITGSGSGKDDMVGSFAGQGVQGLFRQLSGAQVSRPSCTCVH